MFFKKDKDPLDTADWEKKYEIALDIAKQEYLLEIDRYKNIDEKINKYLVIVSMLMAAAILLINELIKHIDFIDKVHISFCITMASLLCCISLLSAIYLLIQGLLFKDSYRVANVESLIQSSGRDNYVQYLHFLITKYEEVREHNVPITNSRISKLKNVPNWLVAGVFFVMLLALVLLIVNLF